jgi:agmatinase
MKKKTVTIGQGHGVEGRYAGLPDPYGSESESKIVLLPVPFDKTSTYQKGSDNGPKALIEASRNMELYDIETNSEVYLNGIYTAPPVVSKTSQKMLETTYKKTKELLHQNKFVVVLGGEHSISYGAIKATVEKYKKLTVLQFDAHTDLQPAYENNPWSHASVMARVKELPGLANVVSVGIRSMSKEEVPYLDSKSTFFSHQLDENDKWMEQVLKLLKGPIYITFDLDAFDSSLMPSTGTPEPGGLFWDQALKILKKVFTQKDVVGLDIVELLPNKFNPAPDYLAAKLIYKMLSYKFCVNKKR